MRIAFAGFQHETNTFAPGTTDLAAFQAPGGWPALVRGEAMVAALRGTSVPTSGALAALGEAGGTPVGILFAMALPSGPVEAETFEALAGEIVTRLQEAHAAAPLDGVFLELHGAMVTTALEDGEGELLRRVRAALGPEMPIAASLDAHANVSEEMVSAADHLDLYRTYPHVDMAETGARALKRLLAIIERGAPFAKAFRQVPFLTSIVVQSTLDEPTATLVASGTAAARTVPGGSVGQAFGFPLADIGDAGPSILAYADDPAAAAALAEAQLDRWLDAEPRFGVALLPPQDAVAEALRVSAESRRQVVIADAQDNPGAGGTCDTTGVLRALLEADAPNALLVHITDPPAVERALAAGVGGTIEGPIGALASAQHDAPVTGRFRVEATGSGRFTGEGPMYRGNLIDLGPVALVSSGGVRIVLSARRMQASEPALPRHLGVEPDSVAVLALKSAVHFRAAYGLDAATLIAKAPGGAAIDLADLTLKKSQRRLAGAALAGTPSKTQHNQ